jgi:polysaccharide export outer membrane protein
MQYMLRILNMVYTRLSSSITQPLAGLTILALNAVVPSPSQAAQPGVNQVAPAPAIGPLPPPRVTPARSTSGQPLPRQGVVPATSTGQPVQLQLMNKAPGQVDYTLGGGDRIHITVLDVPEYSGDYQVPPGGRVYVPLIGSVSVQGLTQAQAADLLTSKYSRYLKRPLVTVSLISPRPINIVVAGEVNRPGSFTVGLQGGAGTDPGVQYPTIIGAISLANGVTLAADIADVQLRRRQGDGSEETTNIDLRKLVKTGNLNQDITLRDGDTIFVPTASQVNLQELRQFSTANFAAPPNTTPTVTVVGEVNRPGPYVISGGATSGNTTLTQGGTITQGSTSTIGLPTVTRAIQTAGGIKAMADIRNVQIHRPTKAGPEQTINVNLWQLLQTGDVNQDTVLQDGDSIVIPRATNVTPAEQTQVALTNFSPDTIQVSVVGEVKAPGLVKLPPNTPLNQAVLTAGGFNNSRAKTSSVELIRLNPNGTVTKRRVPVNLNQGINEASNPTLRNNDIVIVNRSGIARIGDTIGTLLGPILQPLGVAGSISGF